MKIGSQRETCDAVAKALQETYDAKGGGVTVVVEDSCSPAAEVEKALGRLGVLVLVSTPEHRRRPGSGADTAGDMSIEISIFENPKLNRRPGCIFTVTSAAEAAVDALHWRETAGRLLVYGDMRREDAADGDYRMAVSFSAQPATLVPGATVPGGNPEPEETVEARLMALLAEALPDWTIVGMLTPASDGSAKFIPPTCVVVSADVAGQELDWRGPGIPCEYTARAEVRCANADDRTGETFRAACRTVRQALEALLGDGCSALDGNGFSCDAFLLPTTSTTQDTAGDGSMRKTYEATVKGRFTPEEPV